MYKNNKSRYLGYKKEINGVNATLHDCFICGSKLTLTEFKECTDLCGKCKRKGYDGAKHTYKLSGGGNDIDNILINKKEVKS